MLNQSFLDALLAKYRSAFGRLPEVIAYAPGRVEVLGNHTDYNEGYVLSAAINYGTFFAAAPAVGAGCRLIAGDLMAEVPFEVSSPQRTTENGWANYCKGVLAGLQEVGPTPHGFDAMFLGNIPLGSGLSSSAALEMATGLTLARLFGMQVDTARMARIGQKAEHTFAGVKCGLLDQISSLCGKSGTLVETDFRTLAVKNVPMGDDACFLVCNTHAKHALVDGEYNARRHDCEVAAAHFAKVLPHPVTALRDVSFAEWQAHKRGLEARAAARAAHPIGENERVLNGAAMLSQGNLAAFGKLMFESHESSRHYFENSCEELDVVVDACRRIRGVLGARLSGGGFGGSVVALVEPAAAERIGGEISAAYAERFGSPCDVRVITPSDGAHLVQG